MSNYEKAIKELKTKNLTVRSDDKGNELFCYSKSCFFGDDTWNEVTLTHRGKLYHKGREVNRPFKKIFNVNEVPETQESIISERMVSEPYEVLDKANGHLFIVSMFLDDNGKRQTVYSTKGSLPCEGNDLLNDDIKIFNSLYKSEFMDIVKIMFPYVTLMFEAVVEHDKHSMYDLQVEKYGHKNCFVLLGANVGLGLDWIYKDDLDGKHSDFNPTTLKDDPWVDCDYPILEDLADIIGCPVIEKYEEIPGNILEWKEHRDREGYVIRFLTNNDRVKIKTSEYWKNRFKKDLHPGAIYQIFKSGGLDKIKAKLPEEVANQIVSVLNKHFWNWYHEVEIDLFGAEQFMRGCDGKLSEDIRRFLFTKTTFNESTKHFIISKLSKHDYSNRINKTHFRNMFFDYAIENDDLYIELKEVVYKAL